MRLAWILSTHIFEQHLFVVLFIINLLCILVCLDVDTHFGRLYVRVSFLLVFLQISNSSVVKSVRARVCVRVSAAETMMAAIPRPDAPLCVIVFYVFFPLRFALCYLHSFWHYLRSTLSGAFICVYAAPCMSQPVWAAFVLTVHLSVDARSEQNDCFVCIVCLHCDAFTYIPRFISCSVTLDVRIL